MTKLKAYLTGIGTGVLLTLTLIWSLSARDLRLASSVSAAGPIGLPASPPAQGGSDETAPPLDIGKGPTAPAASITNSVATLYFAPQDSDATGTVVAVMNTEAFTQSIAINGYGSGALGYALIVKVGPRSVVHLVTDSLAASPPPSFSDSIVTNFTDFTEYATIDVPRGVRLDGYIVFNPGTGTIDPRADQGAIPLRFSTDITSLLLPAIMR